MNLVKQFYNENAETKYDKKRAIISCQKCGNERDVRYSYYLDCIKNDRKFCKECQAKYNTEKMRIELNLLEPLSECKKIIYKDNKKPIGLFECSSCGEQRERIHKTSVYNQYCQKCTLKTLHQNNKIHPLVTHKHRLHRIINNMIQRTSNHRNKRFDDYGGRGIKVCQEWLNDRIKFYDWALVNGYSNKLSIDRINNDEGYFPENCRWATAEEQQANTRIRKDNTTGYRGVSTTTDNKFRARMNDKLIGIFDTEKEAHSALVGYRLAIASA